MSEREVGRPEQAASLAGFARWLLQERELRGLSRDEVARLGRLPSGVVEKLESGDPQRSPAPAYLFAYLRSYAAAVGLDGDDVVLRWQEAAGPGERPAPRSRAPSLRGLLAVAIALAVAALVVLVLVGPRRGRTPLQLRRPSAAERAARAAEAAPGR